VKMAVSYKTMQKHKKLDDYVEEQEKEEKEEKEEEEEVD